MHYRTLGTTGLQVSLLGYGAWALGTKGWPGVHEQTARTAVAACLEQGVNFFDTAPVYGFGRSEEILGEMLSGARQQVILATKCGLRWDERGRVFHDLSPGTVQEDLAASLSRLKTDYIDLYQIHWPDRRTPLQKTMETLNLLQKQGVIRHIGVCNFTAELLSEARKYSAVASVQCLYNMLQQDAALDILPFCREHGLGVLCYSPLAQGILAGKFGDDFKPGRHDIRHLNPLYRDTRKFHDAVAFARSLPDPPAAAALRFLAGHTDVSSILVSMTRPEHVRENAKALDAA
jgi:aryl-alcohol dehydrogenase-like predicted oxidoreductase